MNTTIEEGLEMILGHLEEPLLWPRPISTRRTGGAQISVDSKQQALAWYKAANLPSVCRLDFNPKQKIDAALDRADNYRPVSRDKLKEENNLLYGRLESEGIIQ